MPFGRAQSPDPPVSEHRRRSRERERAYVDSLGRASGNRPGSLWIRGYLAGRAISAAVDRGARTPGEMAVLLRGNGPAGTLDPTITGTKLPVYVVRGGKAVEPEQR